MKPLVSIICPVNKLLFFPPFWHVVNGQDYPRFEVVLTYSQKGVFFNRKSACENAKGLFIAHFDDDDWSWSGRLSEQVEYLLLHPKAPAVAYTNVVEFDSRTGKVFRTGKHGCSVMYRKGVENFLIDREKGSEESIVRLSDSLESVCFPPIIRYRGTHNITNQ